MEPAHYLADNLRFVPRGRALDIAMGNGRNAVYLAKMGFDVEGIDLSHESIEEATAWARHEGVTLKTHMVDLEGIPHLDKDAYDLIICFNYLQRSLMPQLKDWVKPGGMVIYETFTSDQVRFGRPRNPDYLLKPNELLRIFEDFFVLRYREGIIEDRKAVAGIVAQKVCERRNLTANAMT